MTGDDSRRLLVVSQTYPPEQGGNASRIGDVTRHLADAEWDVTVLSPHPSYPHGQFDRRWERHRVDAHGAVTVHRLWAWQPTSPDPPPLARGLYYLTFAVHALLWVLWTDGEYDVVLTSTPPAFTALPGFVARRHWQVPWVVDVRDLWIDAAVDLGILADDGVVTRLTRALQRRVFWTADRLFVTTEAMRARLADRYALHDDDAMRVVPNGVDTARFDATASDRGDTVVYTGNLGHAQNLEPCIRAMAHVDSSLSLRVVGDGDVRSDLERVAREAGVEDRVAFEGLVERDAVPDYLADAVVGLAPIEPSSSLQYAVPTKVYEYLACGVPVVATGDGAIESFLRSAEGGLVVDSDPVEIAAAVHKLAANPEKRRRIASNGGDHVVETYSRRAIAASVSDDLAALCEGAS